MSLKSVINVILFLMFACNLKNNVMSCGLGSLNIDFIPDMATALSTITTSVNDLLTTHSIEEKGVITSELVSDSIRKGREVARAARRRANQLARSGITLDPYPPAITHFFQANIPPQIRRTSQSSDEILTATKLMQMKVCSSSNVTPNTFLSFLENQVIKIKDSCSTTVATVNSGSRYRSIDGTGNNLKRPGWGRAGASFIRISTPRYADGIYTMPVARSGRPLPSARLLSTRLFYDKPIASQQFNFMNMQFGQFLTHDMQLQLMAVTDEGGIQCCVGEGTDILPPECLNDKCIPIMVPDDDPFYSQHGIRCLNFVRSITKPKDDNSIGYAEQVNGVTSFMDGSMVYGSDANIASQLRSKRGGRLRVEVRGGNKRGFLPSVENKAQVCDLRNASDPCYLAGDIRVNQTPTLALVQTLFMREHNRVAGILAKLNPKWNDERLYQEARRIVVAEIQHIAYQEWMPLNFGESYFRYYRISPTSLYSRDYDEDVNPGTITSFASAAFRYLHTMIPDSVMSCPSGYEAGFLYKLSDHYLNPSLLEVGPNSFDDMVRGIVARNAAEIDPYCTGEITNLLFKSYNKWGLDLVAMDIQRGRDHGIGSYNDFREICGLSRAKTFQDLIGEIPQEQINVLSQLYECVDDIDLYVGGSLERAVEGSILGHTMQCIIAEQFYRTRVGDRFFYDHNEMPHSFNKEQLLQIKKATIARIMLDNTDLKYIQKNAFEVESASNPKYRKDDYNAIPYVDLTPWKSTS